MEKRVAVYIDFENIVISAEEIYGRCDLTKVMGTASRYGRCVIKKAYGDWTRFSRYRHELIEHAIDLTQLFRYGSYSKKNAADIVMAVDALEAAITKPDVQTFVLVTGDSDFSAVARKLRKYGKQVVGIGLRDATSEVLVCSCDEFVIYDTLIETDESPGASEINAYETEQARQLLLSAMQSLQRAAETETDKYSTRSVEQEMRRLDPTFDQSALGYHEFYCFLEAQQDLVTVHRSAQGMTEITVRSDRKVRPATDHLLRYRTAISTSGFRLVDVQIRHEVLQNLYAVLIEAPGEYTWMDLVLQLKERYDAENVLRSREDIQDVAKLLKLADVLSPRPQSWELDPLALPADLTLQDFVQHCESVYVSLLLQKNLDLQPSVLSLLLYETADREDETAILRRLAQANLADGMTPSHVLNGYQWPRHLAESPELQLVLQDLAHQHLNGEPSIKAAVQLNNQGLRIRTEDFERARIFFLQAARMMYELLRSRKPGASLMDLEWYLASYCAATAGAHFSRYNYRVAFDYYLAFFALVKETEPVWDKVRKLVPPMLSFYFTIAPNEHNDQLNVSPGRTHPARLATLLHNHRNPQVRRRWLGMVRRLVQVNPALLRGIIQRLSFLEEEHQLQGAAETRETLTRLINHEPVPDDPLSESLAANTDQWIGFNHQP